MHLVAMIASLGLAGYAGLEFTDKLGTTTAAVWLIGAAATHDLILFPIYTLLDKASTKLVSQPRQTSMTNYMRLPALLSGLLLIVYLPLVAGFSGDTYERITGLPVSVYFGRWLLITGALFALSGGIYALKIGVARKARRVRD